ncbi:MAG: DNA mismatch repair endonuclease MutL [Clostridiales bacterium]|jgi:DNA mismatch repair protein MutL|nr:MAG: DNA mismatch repair endonuclease MutL [Clostridiales bacterium]
MASIQCLDPHVADLIAAGEVVERPASVVKELLENAVDAGSTAVTVEIQRGGMSYIRVTDNGSGIAPEEVETAFLRHATSKIRSAYDLAAIGTLGFRGEALAAIAAVSRVEVMTRQADAPFGAALVLEGGAVREREEIGCPEGTTMIVRDLFFNTPARLKFMKRDAAEGAAAYAAVQHVALSHPEISFRFLRDGREEMMTPGDGKLHSALYAVLGREVALSLLPCKGSGEELSVEGYISRPSCCRGNRSGQHFFVNGRYVKSRTMAAAMEEAYRNQKMVGKFPGCVLRVTSKLNAVDVNVHPAKTEVKFTSEKKLFDAVYYTVKGALEAESGHPQAELVRKPEPKPKQDSVTPNQTFFQTITAEQYRTGGAALRDRTRTPYRADKPTPYAAAKQRMRQEPVFPAAKPVEKSEETVEKSHAAPAPRLRVAKPEPQAAPELVTPDTPQWRIAGEVLDTYIIVEQGDTVTLIDKHAAHERMNFDRMQAQDWQPMRQLLLTPVVLNLPPEESAALLEYQSLLEQFGFETEAFGGGSILVRQVPDDLPADQIESALEEIAGELLVTGRADAAAARDKVLHTMACKAAIKGGWKSSPQEREAVARAVLSGQVKYCPHGRPVAIELTRKQLEKQFKRS